MAPRSTDIRSDGGVAPLVQPSHPDRKRQRGDTPKQCEASPSRDHFFTSLSVSAVCLLMFFLVSVEAGIGFASLYGASWGIKAILMGLGRVLAVRPLSEADVAALYALREFGQGRLILAVVAVSTRFVFVGPDVIHPWTLAVVVLAMISALQAVLRDVSAFNVFLVGGKRS